MPADTGGRGGGARTQAPPGRAPSGTGGAGLIHNPAEAVQRIRRPDLLPDLLRWAAETCALGPVHGHTVLETGYDDCNVVIDTGAGRRLVKIFTAARPEHLSIRYARIMRAVTDAGINHPRLVSGGSDGLLRSPFSGDLLVVMEFVEGASFFEQAASPTRRELADLVRQVHLLHSLDLHPEFVDDWWAIPNIGALVEEVGPLLDARERELARGAAHEFARLDVSRLPKALVHGDLTKTNVMRADSGAITILDFAVSNRYPRVHELAMIAVNLLHEDSVDIAERTRLLVGLYEQRERLRPAEHLALPAYIRACAAMELLGATREHAIKGNGGAETKHLINLGRNTLRAASSMEL
ncbi:phosphotransferase [Nocardiopsis mangrovi]|uniref:Phosphotransferase n=1 Tax=Nocardiopsis mangrovi TaxID=1179818 RepID=A0ABV9E279_9ACTN